MNSISTHTHIAHSIVVWSFEIADIFSPQQPVWMDVCSDMEFALRSTHARASPGTLALPAKHVSDCSIIILIHLIILQLCVRKDVLQSRVCALLQINASVWMDTLAVPVAPCPTRLPRGRAPVCYCLSYFIYN